MLAAWLEPTGIYQVHDFEEVDWIPAAQIVAPVWMQNLGFIVACCRLLIENKSITRLPYYHQTASMERKPLQIAPGNSATFKHPLQGKEYLKPYNLAPKPWFTVGNIIH